MSWGISVQSMSVQMMNGTRLLTSTSLPKIQVSAVASLCGGERSLDVAEREMGQRPCGSLAGAGCQPCPLHGRKRG